MKIIIVEIDGVRHELVKSKGLQPCNECSIYKHCKQGEWVCECLSNSSHYIFKHCDELTPEQAQIRELADNMYHAAQYLTTDASRLHKAMEEYRQYVIKELKGE